MHWRAWVLALATFAILLGVNLSCDPGVGLRRPPRPPGFELERYFGWPASYRAELWDSDDPGLNGRRKSDFRWYDPSGEMALRVREVGWPAAAANGLFALVAAVGAGTLAEGAARGRLGRRGTAVLAGAAGALVGLYLLADVTEVHL